MLAGIQSSACGATAMPTRYVWRPDTASRTTQFHKLNRSSCSPCNLTQHYLPTLFASLGLQQHENCNAWGIAAVDWSKGGAHPRSYR